MDTNARGRSAGNRLRGFSSPFPRRSRSTSKNASIETQQGLIASDEIAPTKSGKYDIVARFRSRSRSASKNRVDVGGGRSHHQHGKFEHPLTINNDDGRGSQQLDDELGAHDLSERVTPARFANAIDQHQLALKSDVIAMMENNENDIIFWKNKALRLTKMSQEGQELPKTRNTINEGHNSQMLIDKVSSLEKEVLNRDILIDLHCKTRVSQEDSLQKMKETFETNEKATEERVRLLENQLQRLAELTTKAASDTSAQNLARENGKNSVDKDKDPAHEVSSLEQLLVRVMAEKDELFFKNQSLKSELSDDKSTSTGGSRSSLGENSQSGSG